MKLSEFLTHLDGVTTKKGKTIALCPCHDDHTPSLAIDLGQKDGRDTVLLWCPACGSKGTDVLDALDLPKDTLSTMEIDVEMKAVRSSESKSAPLPDEYIRQMAKDLYGWQKALHGGSAVAQKALDYARDRFGLDEEDCERFGLGVARFHGHDRLVVPFLDLNGVAVNYQGRALAPADKIADGKRWTGASSPETGSLPPYGIIRSGTGWDTVCVAEGPGDALVLARAGYDVCLIPGVARVNDESVDAALRLAGDRKLVLCFDNDDAGIKARDKMREALLGRGADVAQIIFPDDVSDIADWYAKDGSTTEIIRAVVESKVIVTSKRIAAKLSPEDFPFSDLGMAQWMLSYARRSGGDMDIKYSPEAGWLIYDNGVWREDTLGTIKQLFFDSLDEMKRVATELRKLSRKGESVDEGLNSLAEARLDQVTRYQGRRASEDALEQLKVLRSVGTKITDFDSATDLLVVKNGVVDMRTGSLLPHSPSFRMTKAVDLVYDPQAKAPKFEAFLSSIFPGQPDMPDYIARIIGMAAANRGGQEHVVVTFHGSGSNGKSTLLEVINGVLGSDSETGICVTSPFEMISKRRGGAGGPTPDMAKLLGRRLSMVSEGDSSEIDEATLKRLSGGDTIVARRLYRDSTTFRNRAVLLLATNVPLNLREQSEGLWRRQRFIPMVASFTKNTARQGLVEELIAEEAEGILAWVVRGAIDHHKRKGLADPAHIIHATMQYRTNADQLDGFIGSKFSVLVPSEDKNATMKGSDIYKAFAEWAQSQGWQDREIWQTKTLYRALEERGWHKGSSRGQVVFYGVRKGTEKDYAAAEAALKGLPAEPEVESFPIGQQLADMDEPQVVKTVDETPVAKPEKTKASTRQKKARRARSLDDVI